MDQILKYSFLTAALVLPALTYGQCAPGIPGAGNPGCIPPNQPNSPYYQSENGAPIKAPPKWADRWGAVAMDIDHGKAGAMVGRNSKQEAESVATDICRTRGGSACEILISFYNQCAAVVQSSRGGIVFSNSGYPKERAEERALARCNDSSCHVVFSECSLPEQVD